MSVSIGISDGTRKPVNDPRPSAVFDHIVSCDELLGDRPSVGCFSILYMSSSDVLLIFRDRPPLNKDIVFFL